MSDRDFSRIGLRVGNIQVLHRLGEGGMGSVFVGYDEKLQRKVALKAIRSDRRLEAAARTRFLREARILSQLDDPRICRIYDYLESDAGDFLVLELIDGQNLRQRALAGTLERREILEIGREIAEALAKAHAKGVIHRDLKPDNVMLTADGAVKVLDFGLAQSGSDAPEPRGGSPGPEAHHVEIGAGAGPWQDATRIFFDRNSSSDTVLGTVGYMSPEQARGDRLTTASDLYSLGILLQELLTSEPPFERALSPAMVLVKVAQAESRPVRGLPADLTRLIEALKSPAPAARPTAREAVEKIRWLNQAQRRFRRRLAGAASAALLLAAGFKYTLDLRRERAAAEAARRESEQVLDFVSNIFAAQGSGPAGRELSARELLDKASERLHGELEDQPLSRARLLEQVAALHRNLGLYEQSLTLGREALALREQNLPPGDPQIADSLEKLAGVYWNLSRNAEAEPLYQRCLKIREQAFGKKSIEVGDTLNFLANLYADEHRLDEAADLYGEALALRRQFRGPRSEAVSSTLSNLGNVLTEKNDLPAAEKLYLEAISIKQESKESDPVSLGRVTNNLARLYNLQQRYPEAEKLASQAIGLWEAKLGPSHPLLAWGLNNLANIYRDQGRYADAEPLYLRALAIRRQALTSRNALVLRTEQDYAQSLEAAGRTAEARALRAGLPTTSGS